MTRYLFDRLHDNQSPADIATWLVPNRMTEIAAFADLADTKAQIVPLIAKPAGDTILLQEDDAVDAQPIMAGV